MMNLVYNLDGIQLGLPMPPDHPAATKVPCSMIRRHKGTISVFSRKLVTALSR